MLLQLLDAILGAMSLFFVQGYAMLFALGVTKILSKTEQLLLGFVMSIAMIPFVGIMLDYTFGITPITTQVATIFVVVFFAAIGCIRSLHPSWTDLNVKGALSFLLHVIKNLRVSIRQTALASAFVFVIMLSLWNWQSGMMAHSVDIGTHVFWAKTIQISGHIPNYTRIEPLDEPYKFVFGPHLLLAEFSFLTGLSLETFYWIPLVLISLFTLLGIFLMAKRISGSVYAGIFSAIFFATAFHPGGYIQRGNLPDIIGYFMFISVLYLLLLVTDFGNKAFVFFGFATLSILYYHQYASLIAAATVLLFFTYLGIAKRRKFMELLKTLFRTRGAAVSWILIVVLAMLAFLKLDYVLMRGPRFLGSADYGVQWRSWVVPIDKYPSQVGGVLLVFGLLGILVCLVKRETVGLILLSWISSLLILSNAPLFGVGVPEPYRFIWRMTEPFSVAAGVACYVSICLVRISKFKIQWNGHNSELSKKFLRKITWLSVAAVTMLLIVQVAGAIGNPRYAVNEPYFEVDKQISAWLIQNSDSTDTVVLNADVDNIATWVQAFSMKARFLYKVDAGVSLAPARYKKIYQDMAMLFAEPSSPEVLGIMKSYNITYVVAHYTEVTRFEISPFYKQVYQASKATVYAPVLLNSYGEVSKASGWILPTEDGRDVLLASSLEIKFLVSESMEVTIPIYSHITEPATPDTSLNVSLDGILYSQVFIPKGNLTNLHLNFTQFWSTLKTSGVGQAYYLKVPLEPGTHILSLVYTSDIDFEVYLMDLKASGIAFNLVLPEPT